MTRVEIRIDRLVLHGLPRESAAPFTAALRRELERLAGQPVPPGSWQSRAVDRTALRGGGTPEHLAIRVAHGIWAAVRPAAPSHTAPGGLP